MAKNALVTQAQSAIHLVEEVLLTTGEAAGKDSPVESQRHVDTVQRHPVDFSLPALPIPVRVAVAERAHVHVVTVLGANLESQPSRKHTSCFHVEDTRGRGDIDVVTRSVLAPAQRALAVVLQIPTSNTP